MFEKLLQEKLDEKKELEIFSILAKVINEYYFKNTKSYINISKAPYIPVNIKKIYDVEKPYFKTICLKAYKENKEKYNTIKEASFFTKA